MSDHTNRDAKDSEEKEVVVAHCANANCGTAEIDDVKLKDCDRCDLARYCGNDCQHDHREKHDVVCKQRVAVLRDEILFRQPKSTHLGDCPICFLPLPLDTNKFGVHSCCSKVICNGCFYANEMREIEQRLEQRCPFCRQLIAKNNDEAKIDCTNRAEANNPVAVRCLGWMHDKEGDYDRAFKYWTRAAALGDADAHYNLSVMYRLGQGVEKDEERGIYHSEEAAIAGHPLARYNLALYENRKGRIDRAVKHWIIAASLGDDDSIQVLKEGYKYGHVSKDDFEAALRAQHAAVNAMKSPQRETAIVHYV